MMLNFANKFEMIKKDEALIGRDKPLYLPQKHHFNGNEIQPPWP